jgi:DNA-binding NarL/FixJ family response regulator
MTRIFIVDDHKQFRGKLRSLVETHRDWVVCCEAADGLEAVEKHGSVAPHVTVMDFSMPVLDGLKASRLILVKHPDATILMVTVTVSPQLAHEAKKAGIKGFCHKEHGHCIIDAIEALLRGETYFPSQVH